MTVTVGDRPAVPLARLVWARFRAEQRAFWRNKQAAIFTFLMPIAFLLIFGTVVSGNTGTISFRAYLVPGMIAVSIMSSTFSNLAISLSFQRDQLLLKRLRGTPLSTSLIFGSKIASALAVAVIQVVIIVAIGRGFYDIPFPKHPFALLLFLAVGVACLSMTGIAYTAFIPNGDAAPALVNLPYIGLQFLSGVFFPLETAAPFWKVLAGIFPLRWLTLGMRAAYLGLDFRHGHNVRVGRSTQFVPDAVSGVRVVTSQGLGLAVMAAWFAVAFLVAMRWFRWERRNA